MKRSYAIFDSEGCCVGRWDSGWHYVCIYESYKAALSDARKLQIPGFQVGTASNAMMAKPSKYSR